MSQLAFSKELNGSIDQIIEKVTEALKPAGFGILTRIDFDQKIMEKLGEKIARTVILGACHPKIAFEAFKQSTDVALLIPCNVVVREISSGKVIVEAVRPSQMLQILKDVQKHEMIDAVEENLKKAIEGL